MLQGELVVLREWREGDLQSLATLRNDVGLQALLMAQARPNSIERVRSWLTERSAADDMVFFVAASRVEEEAIGYVQVARIDRFHGHGELGICLSSAAQGRGLGRESCALLEAYLRKTLALRKLTLKVRSDNVRAIAFYRKNGYRDVGVLQRHFRLGDRHLDVLVMERHLLP